jgi:peptidoglycan/LPS O-acetylase OafA/YrhL
MADRAPEAPAPHRFRYVPQLDGLRGFAVLLVLVGHTISNQHSPKNAWAVRLASVGVMIFFALSGYLITSLLCGEFTSKGRISIRNFYLRRALRIMPAIIVYLLAVTVVMWLGWAHEARYRDVLLSLLFMRNLAGTDMLTTHIWSLSIEQQFYLFWPFLFAWLQPRKALWAAVIMAAGIMIWRAVAMLGGIYAPFSAQMYFRTDFRCDTLMAGSALGIFLFRFGHWPGLPSLRPWCHPAFVLPLLILWGCFSENAPSRLFVWTRPLYFTVQTVLSVAVVFWFVTDPGSRWSRVASNPVLRWVGMISYSLYLWQFPFVYVRDADWGWARRFPGDWICTFVLATASYYFVERPFLRLKDRKRTAPPPVPLAEANSPAG